MRYCAQCRDAERPTFTAPVAWEERGNVGLLRGWWRTTAAVTTRPAVFFEQLSTDGGMGPALTFGLIGAALLGVSNTALALLAFVGNIAVVGPYAIQGLQSGNWDVQLIIATVVAATTRVLMVLLAPFVTLALYLTVAVLQHLCLRMVDAGAERGIGATLKVACYAMGVGWVGGLFPYFGPLLVFPVWWTILMVVGTSRVHRRSSTRTLVVLMPTMMLCLAPMAACFVSALLGIVA